MMLKKLLVETLIMLIAVWLLYGVQAVIAVAIVMVAYVPFATLTVLMLKAFKRNRRRK